MDESVRLCSDIPLSKIRLYLISGLIIDVSYNNAMFALCHNWTYNHAQNIGRKTRNQAKLEKLCYVLLIFWAVVPKN